MAKIEIYDDSCCAPTSDVGCCSPGTGAEALATVLRNRPGPRNEVVVINTSEMAVPRRLPPEIAELLSSGKTGLPAIAVDGRVVHIGPLPNLLDALHIIEVATTGTVQNSNRG